MLTEYLRMELRLLLLFEEDKSHKGEADQSEEEVDRPKFIESRTREHDVASFGIQRKKILNESDQQQENIF